MNKNEAAWQNVLAIATGTSFFFLLTGKIWLIWIGASAGLLSLLIPALARLISSVWMGLAHAMGKVSNAVILSVVFFLVLVPIALLARVTGKRGSVRNVAPAKSNYVIRDHEYSAEDLENTW